MLNPEQTLVVEHGEGPLLVAAVAGSGKTRALIHRIVDLIRRGADPKRILAVTFSKAGAREMSLRLEELLPDTGARVGTFHSVAYELIREEVPILKKWTVDTRDRYRYCVKDAVGFRELRWEQCDLSLTCDFIGFSKACLARPESENALAIAHQRYYHQHGPKADPRMLNQAYKRAEEIRRERQLLTFDDMLLDSAELLQNSESARQRWASRWDWVLQDEAQDQNYVQLILGELLAQDHRNYTLVGDPSQAIYAWRGAKPDMLLSFEERWGAKVVKMDRNYRCSQVVVGVANEVLRSMPAETRLDMSMRCERDTPGNLFYHQYRNLDDEAENIAETIRDLLADGEKPSNIAVLYRVNAQSRAPEEAMIGARLPYIVVGGTNFYNRREVKNLLSYLRLAEGRGDEDDVKRCINTPFRYLGKAFVAKVQQVATDSPDASWSDIVLEAGQQAKVQQRQTRGAEGWAELITLLSKRIRAQKQTGQPMEGADATDAGTDPWNAGKPVNLLELILLTTHYTSWLTQSEGDESTENSRVSNIREMVRAARRFATVTDLLDYVEDVQERSRKNSRGRRDRVTLTTIHRSKGLEWKHVFIIGVNEDVLPHGRGVLDEERRLFYVGVTRARDDLHISCVEEIAINDRVVYKDPSRFLIESGILSSEQLEAVNF